MAERLSPAKAVLLAVNFAINPNIPDLQSLTSQYKKTLRTELVLRILLTYLPETLSTSDYVPFLQDLASGQIILSKSSYVDTASVKAIDEDDAKKQVRKLRLEQLRWPGSPLDAPSDPLTLFLIHRAYRIDQETGLSTQLPDLIVPFLDRSPYLRMWMITTLLPLLRLNYEYYPQASTGDTISRFENFGDRQGVHYLLSKSGSDIEDGNDPSHTVGRDLRGLIGPWMYGDNRSKRRKMRQASGLEAQTVSPLNLDSAVGAIPGENPAWEEVFKWITSQASKSWIVCVQAIEQWDGPSDVDLGGYADRVVWLEEGEQQILERRYARAALASAYLISEASLDSFGGIYRILARLAGLLDYERLPSLTTAASLLSPVQIEDSSLQSPENAVFLRDKTMDDSNPLTNPGHSSIALLHGTLLSSFLLMRYGIACNLRKAAPLVLCQDEKDQMEVFRSVLIKVADGPRGDDKYWIRARNELLWLHSWGCEELNDSIACKHGKGIFGAIEREAIETEFLKALLANTRYTLARSIYESSNEKILSKELLLKAVVSAAMQAYDNASNPNRTRGGVKNCNDIMSAFPDTTFNTLTKTRVQALLKVTHSIGQYRLVLRQGEAFRPINLRTAKDPIGLIGKILEQNPQSYTKVQDFIGIGLDMVDAGLTIQDVEAAHNKHTHHEPEHKDTATKRVQAMCIDAALNEDDFETAYSYIMTRLSSADQRALGSLTCPECDKSGLKAEPDKITTDDFSWRAALQAGKYRRTSRTIPPTHVGNASGNLEIRHLEQRLECISLALRIAPQATLQEILNVFRRCEEELETKLALEAKEEAEWDEQGDETAMPGGFGRELKPASLSRHAGARATAEDGPISIFDLTKATASSAQKTMSALRGLRIGSVRSQELSLEGHRQSMESSRSSGEATRDGTPRQGARKRDQLRDAAASTLASGVGWLIGAPTPRPLSDVDSDG